jgi:beta-glucosidase
MRTPLLVATAVAATASLLAAPARVPPGAAIPAARRVARPARAARHVPTPPARHVAPAAGHAAARCPWVHPAAGTSPQRLAAEVVSRMTLSDKLDIVDLRQGDGYENHTTAVPSLCIPELTLQDGPNGLAFGDTGVTQLPASLGLAASFDPSLAYRYGQVLGTEARLQGVDVVQGPNLNLDRLPNSGRAFETYGEDPLLASEMGVADIDGIQSEGVMADAKHFTGYTQETDRLSLDQVIPERELEELYLPPFKAAVEQANVASVMCAYGQINSQYTCEDTAVLGMLGQWGFSGFVRSDLGAVKDPPAAFRAGLDMIKPAAVTALTDAVHSGELPMSVLDGAVSRVLAEMFRFGLIQRPLGAHPGRRVDSPADAALALGVAERSVVLLQDRGGVLPLDGDVRSVAVIGDDAYADPVTAGQGGASVVAPFVVTPLGALRHALGPRAKVTYTPGSSADRPLPAIPAADLVSGVPLLAVATQRHGGSQRGQVLTGTGDLATLGQRGVVTSTVATADHPLTGRGWLSWSATLAAPASGLYTFSLTTSGDSWFYLDGRPVLADPGLHAPATWTVSVPLVAKRRYSLLLDWFHVGVAPELGMADVSPSIAAAVAAAKRASVAVVFAADYNSEGFDRPTLALPGDEDALIEAVSAVNPRTVVVLDTGGPVLMPWLSRVAAVLEAWYPGEEDGRAIAAVLTGVVDPSGRLPMTFPLTDAQAPISSASSWPGVDATVDFGNAGIGYRYYEQEGLTPLFPFGFGLSYTSFELSSPRLTRTASGWQVAVRVEDSGGRAGTEVVQVYAGFPAAAAEARHLVGFRTVTLQPGRSTTVAVRVPASELQCFVGGRFTTLPGIYTLYVGQSSVDLPLRVSLRLH